MMNAIRQGEKTSRIDAVNRIIFIMILLVLFYHNLFGAVCMRNDATVFITLSGKDAVDRFYKGVHITGDPNRDCCPSSYPICDEVVCGQTGGSCVFERSLCPGENYVIDNEFFWSELPELRCVHSSQEGGALEVIFEPDISISANTSEWSGGKTVSLKVDAVAKGCGPDKDLSGTVAWFVQQGSERERWFTGKTTNISFPPAGNFKPGSVDIIARIDGPCGSYVEDKRTISWTPRAENPVPVPLTDECGNRSTSNPIDFRTGEKTDKINDLTIKAPGVDLEFSRHYRSSRVVKGNPESNIGFMGVGWTTNYDFSIEERREYLQVFNSGNGLSETLVTETEDGNISVSEPPHEKGLIMPFTPGSAHSYVNYLTLTMPDGGQIVFRAQLLDEQTGEFSTEYTAEGREDRAYKTADGYRVERGSLLYLFDAEGRLSAITDKSGIGLSLSYETGRTEVSDILGRKLNIETDAGGKISRVDTSVEGFGEYYYGYALSNSGKQRLETVTRPGDEGASYSYYPYAGPTLDYLNKQTDYRRNGHEAVIEYTFDGDKKRYVSEKYGNGVKIADLQYHSDNEMAVSDRDGTRTYTFTPFGAISAINYGYNGIETMEYDSLNRLKKRVQRNGTTEEYHYNSQNRIVRVVTAWNDPFKGQQSSEERYYYDSSGNLTSYFDAKNIETKYEYTPDNRVSAVLRAGSAAYYTYNSDGTIDTISDGERMAKKYFYDSYGNVTEIKNIATGISEYFKYYDSGRDYGKLEYSVDAANVRKTYIYDDDFPGRVKQVLITGNGQSETINYEYETAGQGKGNIKKMTDDMGSVEYAYGPNGLLSTLKDRAGGEQYYVYDAYGRIKGVSDNAAGSRAYNYNHYGGIESVIDSAGRLTEYGYDNMGSRVSVKDRNHKYTRYAYDGLGRLRQIEDANSAAAEYDYDALGSRVLVKDGEGNATQYEYDGQNRMTREVFADNSYVKYGYSAEGDMRRREVYDSSGTLEKTRLFSYDNGHRLTSDGIYTYTYGSGGCLCGGRIESVSGPGSSTGYEYDFKGRVTRESSVRGGVSAVVEKLYDDGQRTRRVKLNGVELFVIETDGEGRALKVREKLGGEHVYEIARDNAGRVSGVEYPSGNRSVTEYDGEGRIKKHINLFDTAVINKYDFSGAGYLDAEGNKLREKTIMGVKEYGYDNIYQLTSAAYEQGQGFTWSYDNAGNREYSSMFNVQGSMSKTYTSNNLNQYSSTLNIEHGTLSNYSYTADGNLLSDGVRSYTWDAKNRLTSVSVNGNVVSYEYDHNDLRVKRTVSGSTQQATRYIYDGSLLLAETDGDGRVEKVYINDGEGIIGMVRYIYKDSGEFSHYSRLYYMYDSLGSVAAVIGENGMPMMEYSYTPYGATMNVERDDVNSLRFVGRYGGYKDDATGLTYFWHRWYDEEDGRWVSRDKVRDAGKNIYEYTYNRPLYYIDYIGLCPGGAPVPVPLPRPGEPYDKIQLHNWQFQPWCFKLPGATHGNYCGGGWSEGKWKTIEQETVFNVAPLDAVDRCCKKHDECAYKYRTGRSDCPDFMEQCNKDFVNCLEDNLGIGGKAGRYAKSARQFFTLFPGMGVDKDCPF